MWNRRVAVSGLVVAAVAFVGACADVPPTEPMAQLDPAAPFSRQALGSQVRTLDAEFAGLAREIPGFGGFFLDEAGNLNVVLAEGRQPVATEQLADRLGRQLQAMGLDVAAAQRLVVHRGDYDFAQLHAWHQRLGAVFRLGGIVFTDADEVANRLRIGIKEGVSAAAVEQAVQRLGIPLEAVIIETAEPIVPESDHTLRDRIRPVAGGLQINFTRGDPPAGFLCTLGFNARVPGFRGVELFFTNSHCSDTRGEVVPTPYWQHSRFVENTFIGWEVFDPPYFTGGECPEGWQCRWSDALVAQYDPGVNVAFGRIWRTTFPGTRIGSLEVDGNRPAWRIVDEIPHAVIGTVLHKSGRTRGWTYGPVVNTCQNTGVAGEPGVLLLCQHRIQTGSAGGDSGSPYFERIGETNRVRLAGLHWGSGGGLTVMSSIQNIRMDIPGSWITH